MQITRLARFVILALLAFSIIGWLLVSYFFLAPRTTGDPLLFILVVACGALLVSLPFISFLRGVELSKRTNKQWYALTFAPFLVGVAILLLLPFSKLLAGLAFILIVFGAHIYAIPRKQ